MKIIDKILIKDLKKLKITILIIVIFIIFLYNLIDFIYFSETYLSIFFHVSSSIVIALLLISFVFYIFDKQKKHLDEQVKQLTDAYQYIGKINRKIDSLIELDISTLDRSKNYSFKKSAEKIFRQLRSLVNAKAGALYLKKPFDYKFYDFLIEDKDIKLAIEKLIKKELKVFKYSHDLKSKQKFIEYGVDEKFFKKFELIAKPVYMHNQDIGLMLLVFSKGTPVEERDLNIIRVFSFYLALNATFKPDFSVFKT